MDRNSSSRSAIEPSSPVLSIECLNGGRSSSSSSSDQWAADLPQTGDIVTKITIGTITMESNFKNGKSGVRNILKNSFKQNDTSIVIWVKRGTVELEEMEGYIVKGNQLAWKTQYLWRAKKDPNHTVAFVDRTEIECSRLQASKTSEMKEALKKPLGDGFRSYPWEAKMNEMQSNHASTAFFSILFLPKSPNTDVQDTVARATTWFNAARGAGTSVLFTSMQTESLLIKISGEAVSSIVNVGTLTELCNIADASVYGFEDIHGVDVGVVRAVRLWFCPEPDAVEIRIEIQITETDRKIGFSLNRTPEGFIYISNVEEKGDLPSSRAGINRMYRQAKQASKLLVVSRISNQTVLPSMVSPTGAIRCFDTISLKHKFALHLHTKVSLIMHVFLGETASSRNRPGEVMSGSPLEYVPSQGEEDSFEGNADCRSPSYMAQNNGQFHSPFASRNFSARTV